MCVQEDADDQMWCFWHKGWDAWAIGKSLEFPSDDNLLAYGPPKYGGSACANLPAVLHVPYNERKKNDMLAVTSLIDFADSCYRDLEADFIAMQETMDVADAHVDHGDTIRTCFDFLVSYLELFVVFVFYTVLLCAFFAPAKEDGREKGTKSKEDGREKGAKSTEALCAAFVPVFFLGSSSFFSCKGDDEASGAGAREALDGDVDVCSTLYEKPPSGWMERAASLVIALEASGYDDDGEAQQIVAYWKKGKGMGKMLERMRRDRFRAPGAAW